MARCKRSRISPSDLAEALEILGRHNALADSMVRARAYADEASQAIATFAPSPERDALSEVVEFCVRRDF